MWDRQSSIVKVSEVPYKVKMFIEGFKPSWRFPPFGLPLPNPSNTPTFALGGGPCYWYYRPEQKPAWDDFIEVIWTI